ncbi:MAG: molybdenum cofactor synthesis domain-containing protein [Candidatus Thorarchaeota archaeon]
MVDLTPKTSHLPKVSKKLIISIGIISDSLSKLGNGWQEKDKSGKVAYRLLKNENYEIKTLKVIPDEYDLIENYIKNMLEEKINVIITIGGTGIGSRDVTIEVAEKFVDKIMPGFGEIFRLKTFQGVGTVAIMTRAFAGIKKSSLIVCLPGSPNAVETGIKLIIPELQHIAQLISKQ